MALGYSYKQKNCQEVKALTKLDTCFLLLPNLSCAEQRAFQFNNHTSNISLIRRKKGILLNLKNNLYYS